MAFALSPGVTVSEIDLTTIVPAVGTTEGAIVGNFNWGPIEEIRSISSEVELVNLFGTPDNNTASDFFSSANFLSYARNLRVVRASSNGSLNATSGGNAVLIKNQTTYEGGYTTGANTYGSFAAKYAGTLGNNLKVSVYAGNTAQFTTWVYNGYFNGAPSTSTYVSNKGGSSDELHVIVVDEDGGITGTANTVLERFSNLSKASDAKTDTGASNYYKDVLNNQSKYIWWLSHNLGAANTNWGSVSTGTAFGQLSNTAATFSLVNGAFGMAVTANTITGYNLFKNADEVDVSLVITSAHNATVVQHVVDSIVEYRKDCVAFASPASTDVVNTPGNEVTNITAFKNTTLNRSSSYLVVDSGWKYQFDKYNNVYRWVPLNADIAGLCVRTDFERDPWFSPAGFNRGILKNVVKLAWNPNQSNRDDLYKIGVNSVVSFPGQGTILYGDKTSLVKPSAFDRINVRRLFIVLEKAIARASKYSLFEFNDAFTRAQFVALVEPFLRDVQGRRGIYDFRVVCDETNNTPEVIDRNEFVGDIYIKPARSINFIQLNFVAVRTGVSFDEIVGQF